MTQLIEAAPELEATAPPTTVPPARHTRTALWIGCVAGATLVAVAYRVAAQSDSLTTPTVVTWCFWGGVLAILLPAGRLLLRSHTSAADRSAAITVIALGTMLPRVLRDPSNPVFFDEMAHWAQTERLRATGELFATNAEVPIARYYPGLHSALATFGEITGLSTTTVALIALAVVHLGVLFGVYIIAARITDSAAIGGTAALVYACNPAFMFFNSQIAYQSLNTLFIVWTLVAVVEASRRPLTRRRWLFLATITASAAIITHHATTALLIGLLVLIAVVVRFTSKHDPARRTLARDLVIFACFVTLLAGLWTLFVAQPVLDYSYRVSPFDEPLFGSGGDAVRQAEPTGLPTAERLLAFAAPMVAVGLAALGWWWQRKAAVRHRAPIVFCTILAAAYALSLPFALLRSTGEVVQRSWPFLYIGLSILIASGLVGLARRVPPPWRTVVPLALIAVLVVGNVGSQINARARYPGPWLAGADSRTVTPELLDLAAWFQVGTDSGRIVADHYTGAALATFASVSTPRGIATWSIYLDETIPPGIESTLREAGYDYLVVDRRMTTSTPRIGFWFDRSEPGAYTYTEPVPESRLDRLAELPWLRRVASSTNLTVYRILDAAEVGP